MRTKKDSLLLQQQLEEHEDFFYIMSEVCGGSILYKHFRHLYPTNYAALLRTWENLNLVSSKLFNHNKVIYLNGCSLLDGYTKPKESVARLLRSIMRMEYYFSLGLDTASEIRQYAVKGNNCVIHQTTNADYLFRLKSKLLERGINAENLDCPQNVALLDRLSCHNSFITRVTMRNGVITPWLIHYSITYRPASVSKKLQTAYREATLLFSDCEGIEVKPHITFCHMGEKSLLSLVRKELRKLPDFLLCSDEDMADLLDEHIYSSALRYLRAENIV